MYLNPGFTNFSWWLSFEFSEMLPHLQNEDKKSTLPMEFED